MPCGLRDSSSQPSDRTRATCTGSRESQLWRCWGHKCFKSRRLSISQRSRNFHLLFAQMKYLNIAAARSVLHITLLLLLWISQLAISASVGAVAGTYKRGICSVRDMFPVSSGAQSHWLAPCTRTGPSLLNKNLQLELYAKQGQSESAGIYCGWAYLWPLEKFLHCHSE